MATNEELENKLNLLFKLIELKRGCMEWVGATEEQTNLFNRLVLKFNCILFILQDRGAV